MDAEVKLLLRGVVVVTRTLLALCAGIIVLLAVATLARPEPRPCRDTVSNIPVGAAPQCAAPAAETRLVLTSAAAATVLTWVGSSSSRRWRPLLSAAGSGSWLRRQSFRERRQCRPSPPGPSERRVSRAE